MKYINLFLLIMILSLASCSDRNQGALDHNRRSEADRAEFSCMLSGDVHMKVYDDEPELIDAERALTIKADYGSSRIIIKFPENIHSRNDLVPGAYSVEISYSDESEAEMSIIKAENADIEISRNPDNELTGLFSAVLSDMSGEKVTHVSEGVFRFSI